MRGRRALVIGLLVAACKAAPSNDAASPAPDDSGSEPVEVVDLTPGKADEASATTQPTKGVSDVAVPAVVVKTHKAIFERPVDDKLGAPVLVVTAHGGAFEGEVFYPVVLFESGSVATWTQTADAKEQVFGAQLMPDEQGKARALAKEVVGARDLAGQSFKPDDAVLGFTARTTAGGITTLFFSEGRMPRDLDQLIRILKARLEATNRADG